ncbi:hypothetical protein BG452_02575 [Streptomyces sp. CBMA123]|nr:hypothetical protein [Streptomyces sp. CBMA123]
MGGLTLGLLQAAGLGRLLLAQPLPGCLRIAAPGRQGGQQGAAFGPHGHQLLLRVPEFTGYSKVVCCF